MPQFHPRITKTINTFEVVVYEMNDLKEENEKLERYLIEKVKKIKIFNSLDDIANMLQVPDIDSEYAKKFKDNLKEICNPKKHKVAAFDIRRSFVTEFMSQLLLEKKLNCAFFEETDKRLNADAVSINKHSPGIDVVGLQVDTSLKFVVCEVKASKSTIPCSETESLLEDINRSKDISSNRVTKEILNFVTTLNPNGNDELLARIVEFLILVLQKKDDQEFVLSNIVFFPFLIRNNNEIIENTDLRDFDLFVKEDFSRTSIKGIIWSFNNDISTFCEKIWEAALENV